MTAVKEVFTLNTISGVTGYVPESYLTHPVLGLSLVGVEEGTKSYDPEFYKPQTAEEYKASHSKAVNKPIDAKPAPSDK